MKVAVKYLAQLKQAAGVPAETVDVEPPCTLQKLMTCLADRHGEQFRHMILDHGGLRNSLLFFVGGEQVRWDAPVPLQDGTEVTIMSPIAGGGESWPGADR